MRVVPPSRLCEFVVGSVVLEQVLLCLGGVASALQVGALIQAFFQMIH